MKKYTYDVDLHFPDGWDTYQVEAECIDSARYAAVMRVINEISREKAETIDTIRVYKHLSWDVLKEYKVQKRLFRYYAYDAETGECVGAYDVLTADSKGNEG